jgi:hypothetical protein
MKTTFSALLIALMSTSALAGTKAKETKSTASRGFTCSMDIEDSEVRPCNEQQRAFAESVRDNLSITPHVQTRDGLAIVPHLVPSDGLAIVPHIESGDDLSIVPHLTADEAYGMCMTDGMVIFDGFVFSYDDTPSTGTCVKWAWALTEADTKSAKRARSEKSRR